MILGDEDLRYYLEKGKIIVSPIRDDTIRENGLDLRIANEIAVEKRSKGRIIDSHSMNDCRNRYEICRCINDCYFIIEPHSLNLFSTIETIELPDDIMGFCALRSTVARHGFIAPITIVDAGFIGTLTIEIFYSGGRPFKLYSGDRFLHLILCKTNSPVREPYNGVYKGQKGVKIPKVID